MGFMPSLVDMDEAILLFSFSLLVIGFFYIVVYCFGRAHMLWRGTGKKISTALFDIVCMIDYYNYRTATCWLTGDEICKEL